MLVVIDGPEKAGKSTLCRAVQQALGFRVRHWDRPYTLDGWFDLSHLLTLREDLRSGEPVIWDRSWASDWVYATLSTEGRIGRDHPWALEWLFGRAADMRIIVPGPGGEQQFGQRTPDDYAVDPATERSLFLVYAKRFGWATFLNEYTPESVDSFVRGIQQAMNSLRAVPDRVVLID